MNCKIIIFLFIFISNSAFGQDNESYTLLSNNSIKYKIVWKPRLSPFNSEIGGRYVYICMSKKLKKFYLNKTFNFWYKKFIDKNSDIATDILLYYLYNKEATTIYAIHEELIEWNNIRNKEIEYWNNFFNKGK